MGQLSFGKRECDRAIAKVPGSRRTTKESNLWCELDGKRLFRITIPKGKSGEFGTGTKKQIVNQFHLSNDEFTELYKCTMTASDYEAKVRAIIAEGKL